jgi:hypothetical protein
VVFAFSSLSRSSALRPLQPRRFPAYYSLRLSFVFSFQADRRIMTVNTLLQTTPLTRDDRTHARRLSSYET